ncbi:MULTISPECIES: type IVB secretion system coupling complex protein DotM/IcmP [Undibacterium]|jgi:intracellular multiplication protein IcmP|uniref:Type IVB secretion system coupling complex protein DotM/IcmP n=1 Tax=Undibacterium umbellatum TaxID=2762300 RepID=A0ABR6ZGC3_9BURK|nr:MULTISPECIES: type IVB secretion system coupling complex protein DotM/IcmP [Undibacterium]MBC3910778.1 type IVB secretion system coupling complex protein DotM/IcmP [Undibacterium umbellatum]MDP1977829.1 type IVB secretion system coupling complex protein DotM/IcmP [Undibacterium sp.]
MPPPQAGNSGNDTSNEGLWGMLLFAAGVLILWFVGKGFIVGAVFVFRSYVTGPLIGLFDADVRAALDWMSSVQYGKVEYNEFVANGELIGRYTKVPAMLLCVAMGVYIFFKHPSQKFKRRWDMFSLAKKEVALWPCITPALDANLLKVPVETGRWAWSTTPKEWVDKNKLWETYEHVSEVSGLPENKRRLNRVTAKSALIAQLGPKFVSFDDLPPYLKALLGSFMAKICGDKKTALKILNQLSTSSAAVGVATNDLSVRLALEKFESELGVACFERYKNTDVIVKILSRHAYMATAMLALLDKARSSGVVASAEFLWLKPVNRTLFYMFNSLGRRTCWMESAGIFAHYQAELQSKSKVMRPYVETALDGLESYLGEYLDTNNGQLE